MSLQERLQAELKIEPTLQDVIDAGQFPTPAEYEKMIWMLQWCQDNFLMPAIELIEADLKGLLEDEDFHAKLRWEIAHTETYGLVDDNGNDVETPLGELFEPDDLIEKIKPLVAAAIERYCRKDSDSAHP